MVLSGLLFQRVFQGAVLAIVVSVSVLGMQAAEPDDVTGTMPEDYLPGLKGVLTQAAKRSPDVIGREFERLAQEGRFIQARAAQLPSVGGGFNYGISETAEASSTDKKYRDSGFFYNFGLNQALFHWGALKNQTDAARINLLVADRSFTLAFRELSNVIRKAYLALIVEKARLQYVRGGVKLIVNEVAIAQARKDAGAISGAALATEQLRLRESELELARLETEFAANRARLARLAGLGELPEDAIPADIPRPAYAPPKAAAMAAAVLRDNAKSTLEYEIYDLRVREAVLQQKIQATRLLPKIGANAGYSLTNTTNVNGNIAEQRAVAQQTIGIGGSWNIFDGLATRGAKREALANRRALEHRKTVEIEQLLQNVQNLERSLRVDAEHLDIADVKHGNAIEGRRLAVQEVGFGKLPQLEIDRAQLNVAQAHARSLEARATFLGRWSDFVGLASADPVLNHLDRNVRKTN